MRINAFIYFVLISLLFLTACGTKSQLSKAANSFEAGEYASALASYSKAYSKIPRKEAELKSQVAFNQAECLRMLGFSRAELVYNRAVRAKYQDLHDSIVYLKLGQAQHRNAKYSEALKSYNLYLEHNPTCVLALNGIIGANQAPLLRDNPTDYRVKRENMFYTRVRNNFSPSFQGVDAKTIFFTSNRTVSKKSIFQNFVTNTPNHNIFTIKQDASEKWSKPELVFSEEFTEKRDIGTPTFSPDGRTMYFSMASQKDEGNAAVEIFSSSRAGGEWTTPQKITFFKDSTISVAHPAIAPDGETIYFVSDAPNGQGGKDIWMGQLDGLECKFIENLGDTINTPGDEMFPYVRTDGTLFFASDGHPGMGGLDIFKAEKIEDEWVVDNMGFPINSNYDDFGIIFENEKERGYFSSNRTQVRGFDAIYSFELYEHEVFVQGVVYDDKKNPIPDAIVRLVSNTGQNTRVVARKDGSYKIKIDRDMDCVMLGNARGFLNKKARFSTEGVKGDKILTVDLILPAAFRPVQIENIFFEFAKWNITPESEEGLQELLDMMNDNPTIKIEISAHTDYVGSSAFNLNLSQKRAQSVVDYLIKAGIEKDRLISKGYGKESPFVVDELLHSQYDFLPVDEVLTNDYIMTLSAEGQEIANQMNRRIEFKVLRMNFR